MLFLDTCSRTDLHNCLLASGYAVLEREHVWHECLITGHGECWTGRGTTADEALDHALAALFPSRAARMALFRVLAAAEQPAPQAEAPIAVLAASPLVDDLPQPEAQPEPPAPVAAEPALPPVTAPLPTVPLANLAGAANAEETLVELESLQRRMVAQRAELAVAAPARQRLVLLGWLAEIRACQTEAGASFAVRNRASELVAEIRSMSERWWPGMIAVLAKDTRPPDAKKDLRGYGPMMLLTWRDVAQAARDALEETEANDFADGRDDAGWADSARLVPPPENPEAILADVRAEIETVGGDVFGRQPKFVPAPRSELLLGWAQRLRWLRGSVDAETWAGCIGRVRFWAQWAAGSAPAREILDPAYLPPRSWAQLVRSADDEQRELEELAEVLAATPGADASANELVTWLGRALPLTTHHQQAIVQAVQPLAHVVAAVDESQLPGADRRIRRRLQKLKDALVEPAAEAAAEEQAPAQQPAQDTEPAIPPAVIACTQGRKALFVSNRNDQPLADKLLSRFHFAQLEWKESSPRRIAQAVEAIKPGRFDMVLSATGFLDHAADCLLARACRSAGIAYLRVERGRPTAVLQALERDLVGPREQA